MAKAKTGAPGADEAPQERLVVKYIGDSHSRSIAAEDWARMKIRGQGDLLWDSENGHMIDAESIAPEAVAFLEGEEDFCLETGIPLVHGEVWVEPIPEDAPFILVTDGVAAAAPAVDPQDQLQFPDGQSSDGQTQESVTDQTSPEA